MLNGFMLFYRRIRSHGRRVAKKAVVAVVEVAEGRVGPEQVVQAQRPPVAVVWPIGLVSWRNTFTIRTRPLASVFTINNNPHLSRLIRGTMAFPVTWVRFYCNSFILTFQHVNNYTKKLLTILRSPNLLDNFS